MNSAARVGAAVTALFVPGDRPERFAKATGAGADIVIVDLEDAVAPAAKAAARQAVRAAMTGPGPLAAVVRVNAAGTEFHDADLDLLAELSGDAASGLLGVMLPKAESPTVVECLVGVVGTGRAVVPLVESAVGVLAIDRLARVPGVTRLALGAIDLTADVDADLDSPVVTHAIAQLVLASRAARIAAPLDSPATAITDLDAVTAAGARARACGFGGKLCIHPAQIDPVRAGFRPSAAQLDWARRVIGAGAAAVQIDGQMIDKPVIDRARHILRRAGTDA